MMSTPEKTTSTRIMTRSQRKKVENGVMRMRLQESADEDNTKSNQRKTPKKQPKEPQQRVLRSLQVDKNGELSTDNKNVSSSRPTTRSAMKKKLTKQEKAVAFERARSLMRSTTPAKQTRVKINDENEFMNVINNAEDSNEFISQVEHKFQDQSPNTKVQQEYKGDKEELQQEEDELQLQEVEVEVEVEVEAEGVEAEEKLQQQEKEEQQEQQNHEDQLRITV